MDVCSDSERMANDTPVVIPRVEENLPFFQSVKRRFPPNHNFFISGNIERELQAKQMFIELSQNEIDEIRNSDIRFDHLTCPIKGCSVKISSLSEFDAHYSSRHILSCSVCKRIYPTSRLLDLHIAETHDSFFKAKVAKGYSMYECLVEDCNSKFLNEKSRHRHLVDKHRFPRTFEFTKKRHLSKKRRQKLHRQHPSDSSNACKESKEKLGKDEFKLRGKKVLDVDIKNEIKPLFSRDSNKLSEINGSCQLPEDLSVSSNEFISIANECNLIETGNNQNAQCMDAPMGEANLNELNLDMEIENLSNQVSKLSTNCSNAFMPREISFGRRRNKAINSHKVNNLKH